MKPEDLLTRLREETTLDSEASDRIKKRVTREIDPSYLAVFREIQISAEEKKRMRASLLSRLVSPAEDILPVLRDAIFVTPQIKASMKESIFGRLAPVRASVVSMSLKWTAAFALTVFLIRLMPLALLAPATQASSTVQVIAYGNVSVVIAGLEVPVTDERVLDNAALIRTDEGEATILLHDDAVIRLAPNTTVRLHDLTDRPDTPLPGPTLTFVKGKMWMHALIPLTLDSMLIELPTGNIIGINEGSISVDEKGMQVAVLDKRVVVSGGASDLYIVNGEKVALGTARTVPVRLRTSELKNPWIVENLERDSAHRQTLALRQRERREENAGILPTSILYPVKRVAEQVDVLFTVGSEAKAQKRIQHADTRLSEALTLLTEGQAEAASGTLMEYKKTLLTLATGTGDNLVKFLIKKQLDGASADTVAATPGDALYAVKESVLEMSAVLPDADIQPAEVQGYILVDKLSTIDRALTNSGSVDEAVLLYNDIKPYLKDLLSQHSDGVQTLQKEAKNLLQTASSALADLKTEQPENTVLSDVHADIDQFLPKVPPKVPAADKKDATTRVQEMLVRIFNYKMPRSRYNQLLHEMRQIEHDPDRGMILRELYHALPENGLAGYVRTEIQKARNDIKAAQ